MIGMHLKRRMLWAVCVVMVAYSCAAPVNAEVVGAATCGPAVHTPPSTVDLATRGDEIREAIRCLINAERARVGLRPVVMQPTLAAPAQAHADRAGLLQWWGKSNSHIDPELDRMGGALLDKNAAIEFRLRNPQRGGNYCAGDAGAIIGEITRSGAGFEPEKKVCTEAECSTPLGAVNWWMNISKDGHRETILTEAFREVGVGVIGKIAFDDPNLAKLAEQGSYVVDFGVCPSRPADASPSGAASGGKPVDPTGGVGGGAFAGVAVHFNELVVNDCPEIGKCDWKLKCRIGPGEETELLEKAEGDNGDRIAVDRMLRTSSRFPIEVTCSALEFDDALFGFIGNSVWELVGTITKSIARPGATDMVINQNTKEGDVTVKMFVEPLAIVSQPSTAPPAPQAAIAPTACRVSPASGAICGDIAIECARPLPAAADRFVIADLTSQLGLTVRETDFGAGVIRADYFREGDAVLTVCGRSKAGAQQCSNTFAAKLGPTSCPAAPSRPRLCPSDQERCPMHGCVPLGECQRPQ